jgi:lipopolysaccharide transport system ATP-binding protein
MLSSKEPQQQTMAISVCQVSKKFRLFNSPKERIAEALHPFRKKYHREYWALKEISFDVYQGEIIGILGKNGSGKSTLLQIICAVMQPTEGKVEVSGRISALLELGAGFNPEFSGRENVILNGSIMGISRHEMLRRLPDIEAFADIGEFFDQPVKTYSSGMFVRVAFAVAIHVEPEILVVDEALSVGDSKFQHRCFQRIRKFMEQGKTIVVVSHSTDTLLRICHRGIVLDSGKLGFIGPISDAVNHYQNLLFGSPVVVDNHLNPAHDNRGDDIQVSNSSTLIGALSNDTYDKVSQIPGYNAHEVRLGNGVATIIDIDLISDGLVNPHEIPVHSETELIIKVKFNEDIVNASVGFAFVTTDGTYVFGTNMFMMQASLINGKAGEIYAIKFLFESRLAGGDYFLNVGCNQIADGSDKFLDVRRSVSRIKVSDTPSVTGFVDLSVVHEVIDLNLTRKRAV